MLLLLLRTRTGIYVPPAIGGTLVDGRSQYTAQRSRSAPTARVAALGGSRPRTTTTTRTAR